VTKSVKIALLQEMLLELPREAASTIRAKECLSMPPEDRLTDEEWERLFDWLDEVNPRRKRQG
jgi:hypothetical protein